MASVGSTTERGTIPRVTPDVADSHGEARRAIEAVWRIESARLIAALTRTTGDVGLAEELAQDALVAALEQWAETGVPDNPGAWLMTTAKNRAIDRFRRDAVFARKAAELGRELEWQQGERPDLEAAMDTWIEDDLLRLIFVCCHPVLTVEARVALTLRLLGGLSTEEIARAFLEPTATVAARITRAKRALAEAEVPIELPPPAELGERLGSVLAVVYLIFNEGYSATSGDDLIRPALCEEALRLGRILAELVPGEPEVHGLAALIEIQSSRLRTRVDRDGEPVLLMDQDRSRWDRLLITRGLAALDRALVLERGVGPYVLQASIAACHARAATPEGTDWPRIAALYGALVQLTPSPVIELNRAVAVGMADGPAAGLEIADRLAEGGALEDYHLLAAVRGDLLERLGQATEARAEFERAAGLTRNERERRTLQARGARCAEGGVPRRGG